MQSQIKAIETVYKGFCFRSRLEARWAVFFDALRIPWNYEHEGYVIEGVRYLPDFWLPEHRVHVEVKPGPAPNGKALPRVYFAGRMGANYKHGDDPCYRPFDTFHAAATDKVAPAAVRRNFLGIDLLYTGPFRAGWGNHCATHGDTDDGAGSESTCFHRSLHGIREADVVFALFEDLEAFGTLAEVGYAHALGKRIFVGLAGSLGNEVDRAVADHAFSEISDAAGHRENHLWFACRMAEEVFANEDRARVLGEFQQLLRTIYPLPREQRLIDNLARATGANACVVYGDPVDAIDQNSVFVAQSGEIEFLSYPDVYDAAEKSRQARFEHGQSGAR